jgi:uncharacterized protein
MAERSENELADGTDAIDPSVAIYIDSSALAKLYLPEAESDALDAFLSGRRGLTISELAVTEVLSAVARRKRDGELRPTDANRIRDALLSDAGSGVFRRLDLTPEAHREAESLLFLMDSLPVRTLDALHMALALQGDARHVLTYDRRMAEAATGLGINVIAPRP